MSLLTSVEFDDCRRWIKKKRNKGNTWDSLLFAGKATEQALENFLNNKKDEDDWPPTMSVELWKKLVIEMEKKKTCFRNGRI